MYHYFYSEIQSEFFIHCYSFLESLAVNCQVIITIHYIEKSSSFYNSFCVPRKEENHMGFEIHECGLTIPLRYRSRAHPESLFA